jgi:hypothetical protein
VTEFRYFVDLVIVGSDEVPPCGPRSRDESNTPSVCVFHYFVRDEAVLWYDID